MKQTFGNRSQSTAVGVGGGVKMTKTEEMKESAMNRQNRMEAKLSGIEQSKPDPNADRPKLLCV